MLKRIKNKKDFVNIMKYVPMERTLNILKYSKYYLGLLNMNNNCFKYYKILRIIGEIDPQTFIEEPKYFIYITANDIKDNPKNIYCFSYIKKRVLEEVYIKNIKLFLHDSKEEKNARDISVKSFLFDFYIKDNDYKLNVLIFSDVTLSQENEDFIFETLKPERTNLYLEISDENKIIDKFLEKWRSKIFSLTFSEDTSEDLFKKILIGDGNNCISKLIIHCDINAENRNILFKEFLPKCNNLKFLSLNDFPSKSEKYGNFLENCKSLENLEIIFNDDKSIDTLNYIILKGNNLKVLKILFDFDCLYEKKFIEMDFSYIKNLIKLEELEISYIGEGEIMPKNLINGLNNLKKLKKLKLDTYDFEIKEINKIKIPSLKELDIYLYDIKSIIENHNNLTNLKINYIFDECEINFPKNLEKINLFISSDELLLNLFKQIQINKINLIELNFRVDDIFGRIEYNTLQELANCFKILPNLKILIMEFLVKIEEKRRNIEWLENIKYLKNLSYYELNEYKFTIDELEIFLKSIQNLEFLYQIELESSNFELKKVMKLLSVYKLPPILKQFNLISLSHIKKNDKNKDEVAIGVEKDDEDLDEDDTKRLTQLVEGIGNLGYPILK